MSRVTAGAMPRISVITPSMNQGRYIEETIRSVCDQHYQDVEHIVVDGGSRDETAEIVSRYPQVRFIQEPDLGQAHAINKGILRSTGDVLAYLNSDDVYRPGALQLVGRFFSESPEAMVLAGACDYIDDRGETTGHLEPRLDSYDDLLRYWGWDRWYCIPQQAVFWRRSLLAETGLFDIRYDCTMDYEMWLRMAARHRFVLCRETLAGFRLHADGKTTTRASRMYLEHRAAARRYWPGWWRPRRWAFECISLRHTARQLIAVAEHEVLALHRRRSPLRLLRLAVQRWPVLVLDPRLSLTALSAVLAPTAAGPATMRLHRRYLSTVYRLRHALLERWSRRKISDVRS